MSLFPYSRNTLFSKDDLKERIEYLKKFCSKEVIEYLYSLLNLEIKAINADKELNGLVNCKDINLAWKYLNKAIELGSIAAINTMGNCYLNGKNIETYNNFPFSYVPPISAHQYHSYIIIQLRKIVKYTSIKMRNRQ